MYTYPHVCIGYVNKLTASYCHSSNSVARHISIHAGQFLSLVWALVDFRGYIKQCVHGAELLSTVCFVYIVTEITIVTCCAFVLYIDVDHLTLSCLDLQYF